MTIKELKLEIATLKDRLSKAIIFEVAPGISVGLSEEDELWRIRRDAGQYSSLFLNRSGLWEDPPMAEDEGFALRTGYDTSTEALIAYEQYASTNPLLLPEQQAMIDMASFRYIAKNN